MHKGINIITNDGLGVKLTNSMSFGESVFSRGFIQKTVKVDLHVRFNHAYPQWKWPQKVPEDSRGLYTEAGAEGLPGGAGRPTYRPSAPRPTYQPLCQNVGSPPSPRLHLRHPLSWFDPRAHVGPFGLYKDAQTNSLEPSWNPNSYSRLQDQSQLSRED